MPGPYLKDTLDPKLTTAQSVASSAVGDEGIKDVRWPHHVQVEAVTTTAVSNTGSVNVEIQSSPSASFASDVVQVATLGPLNSSNAGAIGARFAQKVYVPHRYVRAWVRPTGTVAGNIDVTLRHKDYIFDKKVTAGAPTTS